MDVPGASARRIAVTLSRAIGFICMYGSSRKRGRNSGAPGATAARIEREREPPQVLAGTWNTPRRPAPAPA
jgi:hypothetical protein